MVSTGVLFNRLGRQLPSSMASTPALALARGISGLSSCAPQRLASQAALRARGFPRAEFEERLLRFKELMREHRLDAVFITTEQNFQYFSGLQSQFWQSPTRPFFMVLPADPNAGPIAVVPEIAAEPMQTTWVEDIRTWKAPQPEDDGVSLLVDALSSVPRRYGRIGATMGHESHVRMPMADFMKVTSGLATRGLEIADASPAIREIRSIKSELEVNKIHQACAITSGAFEALPGLVRPLWNEGSGIVTERDVVCELRREVLKRGADGTPYMIAQSGPGGYHNIILGPTDRQLQDGDVAVIDTGTRFDGYFCDFDRNFMVGYDNGSAAEAHRAHEWLWQATEAGIKAAVPGNKASDMYHAIVDSLVESSGGTLDTSMFSTGRMGHGLGMNLTEWPSVAAWDDTPLKAGMVMTVEPGLTMSNGTVQAHEENLIITEDGPQMLTTRADSHMMHLNPRIAPASVVTVGRQRVAEEVGRLYSPSVSATTHTRMMTSSATAMDPRSVAHVDDYMVRYSRGVSPGAQGASLATDTVGVLDTFASQLADVKDFHTSGKVFAPTPLVSLTAAAQAVGVHEVLVKDEGQRMGLKAFKGLGVSYAVHKLMRQGAVNRGDTLTTMTDGNHGRAVARVARLNGCDCVVFVPECMVPARRKAIEDEGATVVVVQGSYDDAIETVKAEAARKKWQLISDTAWEGYSSVPLSIMSGYNTMFREVEDQRKGQAPITHVLLQAGVGGFAAAGAASVVTSASAAWARDARVVIVEPTDADCILENVKDRSAMDAPLRQCEGQTESIMSGLNCGMPSTIAFPILRDVASLYLALGDGWARDGMRTMYNGGLVAGESGAAGFSGLQALMGDPRLADEARALELNKDSVVLCINTEGDTDPDTFRTIVDYGTCTSN